MNPDFSYIRAKYPRLTNDECHQVVALLNRPTAAVCELWEGEAQLGDVVLD